MSLFINLAGLLMIALIIWWFWLWKPRVVKAATDGVIEIIVDKGIYSPANIEIPSGAQSTLRFVRKDPSPCSATVIFDGLGLSQELPIDQPKEITIKPEAPGDYAFHCQMNMYKGQIKVTG